jgi:hypothetical protein
MSLTDSVRQLAEDISYPMVTEEAGIPLGAESTFSDAMSEDPSPTLACARTRIKGFGDLRYF